MILELTIIFGLSTFGKFGRLMVGCVPRVTVCVITFNQSKYIRECLDGILRQKTNFIYEVIVGDDASSDGTSEIIGEYAERYGEKVHHILRCKNLGSRRNFVDVLSRAKGMYLAICEGDDFWSDENKLQRQYETLEKYSGVDLCFHSAIEYRQDIFFSLINKYSSVEQLITTPTLLQGRGGFMPSASLFMRRDVVCPLPSWFVDIAPVGDIFLQGIAGMRGGAVYLPEPMCIYRRFSEGSRTGKGRLEVETEAEMCQEIDRYVYCYGQLSRLGGGRTAIAKACQRALSLELFSIAVRSIRYGHSVVFKKSMRHGFLISSSGYRFRYLIGYFSLYIYPLKHLLLRKYFSE